MRFHAPPGWPTPPPGWTPPSGWQPHPDWPPAPPGWAFWVPEQPTDSHSAPAAGPRPARISPGAVAATVAAVAIAVLVVSVISAVLRTASSPAVARSGPAAEVGAAPARQAATASRGPTSPSTASPASPSSGAPVSGPALAALATVPVKGRAPRTGYDREDFGPAWADTDRNGCDTRNDVLRRDLRGYVLEAGTGGCLVLSGTLLDPYTGRSIRFVRGPGTSTQVQIDHVVALSDAWQKGAQGWTPARRERFANDPLNLLAVDGPTNQRKGDGDAATWLPPSSGYRCTYVARQVAVKRAYGLWMTSAERAAVARVLARCPGQRLPVAGAFRLGGGTVRVVPAAPSAATGRPRAAASSGRPSGYDCPPAAPIKGNASSMIYHLPGGAYYERTKPEECFSSEAAARAAGYRAAKR